MGSDGLTSGTVALFQSVFSEPLVSPEGPFGLTTGTRVCLSSGRQRLTGSTTTLGESHAFIWTEELGMVDMGTLGGNFSFASAINNHGLVTGRAGLLRVRSTSTFGRKNLA